MFSAACPCSVQGDLGMRPVVQDQPCWLATPHTLGANTGGRRGCRGDHAVFTPTSTGTAVGGRVRMMGVQAMSGAFE